MFFWYSNPCYPPKEVCSSRTIARCESSRRTELYLPCSATLWPSSRNPVCTLDGLKVCGRGCITYSWKGSRRLAKQLTYMSRLHTAVIFRDILNLTGGQLWKPVALQECGINRSFLAVRVLLQALELSPWCFQFMASIYSAQPFCSCSCRQRRSVSKSVIASRWLCSKG